MRKTQPFPLLLDRWRLIVVLALGIPTFWGGRQPLAQEKVSPFPFNGDSAFAYVAKQVAFGPRVPNTKAHRLCGEYLVGELKRRGWKTASQTGVVAAFDGTQLEIRNIFAQLSPEKANRILLLAHWDSRPFADKDSIRIDQPIAGANDGASGVGVLLEIARVLASKDRKPFVGVDILLVDAEDYGPPHIPGDTTFSPEYWCLGSRMWARQAKETGYSPMYGILLDMVGAKDAVFTREHHSMEQGHFVMNRVWRIAERLGHQPFFSWEETQFIGIDDHIVVYEETGIPCIDIIHYDATSGTGFFDDHHTHGDVLDQIDPKTLTAVGETLLELIYTQY